jgi:flavin reductase (DIM6/NTAB) family NADH-FMN oxidoreductase RutF
MMKTSKVFTVNILGKTQKHLAEHFVKPAATLGEKLQTVKHQPGATGAPLLDEAIAFVECQVREIANEAGDHAVVIGEVIEAGVRRDEPALTLMDTGWHYGG